LRLAVVSPFVDRRHGTERALAELIERLARDYHCAIHLYAQRAEDLALDQKFAGSKTYQAVAPGAQEQGEIIWHRVPSIPGPHLVQFLFWLLSNAFCRWWDSKVNGLRFDLVLSPGINCFDADLVVVHALFHRLRELASDDASRQSISGLFRHWHRRVYYSFLTWLERRIYTKPGVSLAAVSVRTASLLKEYFRRNEVRVIPNGVDAAYFCPSKRLALRAGARARYRLQETDFLLLLIGNDWRNKGLSTILAAMAAVREIPLRLLITGQDAAAPSFQETAGNLALGGKCHWETTSADVMELYAAADLYVSPSYEDSFGMPVLEAMACGLTVITSVKAGVSEFITESVDSFVLKDPKDVATLARHLKDLYENPDMRLRIGESARRTAEAFTWERNAAAVWEFMNEAASKKRT
jgi:glycosyltransferase involved in cell wall biosynthesis